MKKLLLLILIVNSGFLFGQSYTYHPFPVDSGYWKYRYFDDYGGWTPILNTYNMSGDTIISGLNYKKITNSYLSGAIRENNKTIYFYPDTASQEYVIYDFNLIAGDTLINPYGCQYCSTDPVYVFSTDTITNTYGTFARWYLSSSTTWIEGIGADVSLFNSTEGMVTVSGHDRLEYMEGDTIIKYNNPLMPPPPPNCYVVYYTSYDTLNNTFNLTVPTSLASTISSYLWDFGDGTTSTLPSPSHFYPVDSLYNVCMTTVNIYGDTCSYCHVIGKDTSGNIVRNNGFYLNVNSTGINEFDVVTSTIYPNPTTGQIHVQLSRSVEKVTIRVFNITGRLLTERQNISGTLIDLDISNEASGMYFIEIYDSGRIYRNKLIKE